MYIVLYYTVGHTGVNDTLTTKWKSTIHIVCTLQSAQLSVSRNIILESDSESVSSVAVSVLHLS